LTNYIPDTGDVLEIGISAEVGKEALENKFVLVISEKIFNNSGYAFLCPIQESSINKDFEVEIPPEESITGIILCNHVKSIDWRKRLSVKVGTLSANTVNKVKDIVEIFLK
jgi:mRNA interferase MazF